MQVLRRLGLATGAHVRRRNRLLVDSNAYAARFVRRMLLLLLLLLLLLCGGSLEATRRAQVTLTAIGSAASEGKSGSMAGRGERRGERREGEERGERERERGERERGGETGKRVVSG